MTHTGENYGQVLVLVNMFRLNALKAVPNEKEYMRISRMRVSNLHFVETGDEFKLPVFSGTHDAGTE